MKKKLNFITILIGIAVGIGIMTSKEITDFKEDFMKGRTSAVDAWGVGTKKSFNLSLVPVESYTMPDKLLNKKSGELDQVRIREAIVRTSVEKKANAIEMLWMFPCSIIALTGFFMVVFNFLKIVFAVNKSIIFAWININRLRRVGIGFVVMFIIDAIVSVIQKSEALGLIEFENYEIVNFTYEGSLLLLGMISFLFAEILAAGLRLKEEQELTI